MPFYVSYRRGDEVAKVYDKLEDVLPDNLTTDQLNAAIKALEGVRDFKPSDFKVAKRRPVPYEWTHGDQLLVKCLLDWTEGTVMIWRPGWPTRFTENRHLGVYQVMKDELAGKADWRAMAAMWLGLASAAVPDDPLTYLLGRRGLALHWIEERIRNQVPDYRIIELRV